jgi:RNA-directed DNA polymerase
MTLRLSADDAILASQFKALKTFGDIAVLLEVTPQVLGFYLHRKNNYKVFQLKKRSGGVRVISSPVTPLKIIQRKLNQVLQAVYGGRAPVHGFARGKNIVTNASKHLQRGLVLNFDLEDFFPSIHFGRVKGLFEGKGYGFPEPVAITLAQICCHNGTLPAGAPSSPTVANMICGQMDMQLKQLAIACGAMYTRYADDITFSTHYDRFHPSISFRDTETRKWKLGDALAKIVTSNGFKIQESKTRVQVRGQRQEVTGLLVGKRLNVKRAVVRQARAMLHAAEKWGVVAAANQFKLRHDKKQRKQKADFLRVLRGRIEFVGFVRGRDDLIYIRLIDRFLGLDPRARVKPILTTPNSLREVLEMAIWVLEEEDGPIQGTAFAADGLDLVTAAHVLGSQMLADCPAISVTNVRAIEVCRHDGVDVGRVKIGHRVPVFLKLGDSRKVKVGDPIRVLGFPLHVKGASVHVQEGKVSQYSPWIGVPQFVVDCPIVHGNSGGPVLNAQNEVIGIAVKGQGLPGGAREGDTLSRFVPIDFAVDYLKRERTQP